MSDNDRTLSRLSAEDISNFDFEHFLHWDAEFLLDNNIPSSSLVRNLCHALLQACHSCLHSTKEPTSIAESSVTSRHPCRNCKDLHLLCDQQEPACSQCTERRVACPGSNILVAFRKDGKHGLPESEAIGATSATFGILGHQSSVPLPPSSYQRTSGLSTDRGGWEVTRQQRVRLVDVMYQLQLWETLVESDKAQVTLDEDKGLLITVTDLLLECSKEADTLLEFSICHAKNSASVELARAARASLHRWSHIAAGDPLQFPAYSQTIVWGAKDVQDNAEADIASVDCTIALFKENLDLLMDLLPSIEHMPRPEAANIAKGELLSTYVAQADKDKGTRPSTNLGEEEDTVGRNIHDLNTSSRSFRGRTLFHGDASGYPSKERKKTIASRRRTKTGCLTCRMRRIKCDERKPTCENCNRSRRRCDGYVAAMNWKDVSFPNAPPATIVPIQPFLSGIPQDYHHQSSYMWPTGPPTSLPSLVSDSEDPNDPFDVETPASEYNFMGGFN